MQNLMQIAIDEKKSTDALILMKTELTVTSAKIETKLILIS